MPHAIEIKECTVCAACEVECPSGSISLHASDEYYVIDPETCTDCGECIEVCPVDAIAAVAQKIPLEAV